uniref:Transmembrane protein n=1 Tax=Caenorhabditis japonica TaxID=281687 RepID=A0A8R1ISL9_CAEJA
MDDPPYISLSSRYCGGCEEKTMVPIGMPKPPAKQHFFDQSLNILIRVLLLFLLIPIPILPNDHHMSGVVKRELDGTTPNPTTFDFVR